MKRKVGIKIPSDEWTRENIEYYFHSRSAEVGRDSSIPYFITASRPEIVVGSRIWGSRITSNSRFSFEGYMYTLRPSYRWDGRYPERFCKGGGLAALSYTRLPAKEVHQWRWWGVWRDGYFKRFDWLDVHSPWQSLLSRKEKKRA